MLLLKIILIAWFATLLGNPGLIIFFANTLLSLSLCHFCAPCKPSLSLLLSNKDIWETILQLPLQTACEEQEIWDSCKWTVGKLSRASLISPLLRRNKRCVIPPHTIQRRIEERANDTNRFSSAKKGVFTFERYNYTNTGPVMLTLWLLGSILSSEFWFK